MNKNTKYARNTLKISNYPTTIIGSKHERTEAPVDNKPLVNGVCVDSRTHHSERESYRYPHISIKSRQQAESQAREQNKK